MTGKPRYVNVCIWFLKVNAVLDLIGSDKLVKGKRTLYIPLAYHYVGSLRGFTLQTRMLRGWIKPLTVTNRVTSVENSGGGIKKFTTGRITYLTFFNIFVIIVNYTGFDKK